MVNSKSLGIIWKKPFCVDVTEALKPGENAVEVKVTKLWVNRLIGDQQLNVTRKYTYTTMPFYRLTRPCCLRGYWGRYDSSEWQPNNCPFSIAGEQRKV